MTAENRPDTRLVSVDLARTVALFGMAVFHFTFDLELMGFVPPGTTRETVLFLLARSVAGSFLALAGFSLVLAHGRGLRAMGFARRLAMISVAAGVITLATFYGMPSRFIYFGILHSIALSSVLGLLFLRLPFPLTLATGAAVIWAGIVVATPALNGPWLWWLGLGSEWRASVDFVPIFPWFGAFLLGMGAAQAVARMGLSLALPPTLAAQLRPYAWPGRHSLAIYLIHQPVLFSLVWAARHFSG